MSRTPQRVALPPESELPEAAFIADPLRREAVRMRAALLQYLRSFCADAGFLEVQTPLLHTAAETANVHQYKLEAIGGRTLWVRTDPEEYLKRYLTAGFDAVYELSLNVRAEAPDANRLHEFVSLECYRRNATLEQMIALCHALVRGALQTLRGSLGARLQGHAVTWNAEPLVRSFHDLMRVHAGIALEEFESAQSLADRVHSRFGWNGTGDQRDELRSTWLEWLVEHQVLPAIDAPVFVTHFPSELGLSARPCPQDPRVSLRAELYFPHGWELAHLYENLTEPRQLRERLLERRRRRLASGYPDVPLDEGLLGSAALGMPSMSGFALGVDRLLMLMLGDSVIGRGMLFPREGFAEDVS
jgi:lysyl-tRNA synthetase class 2